MKKKIMRSLFRSISFGLLFLAMTTWVAHPLVHSHVHDEQNQVQCFVCRQFDSPVQFIGSAVTVNFSLVVEWPVSSLVFLTPPSSQLTGSNPPRAPPLHPIV